MDCTSAAICGMSIMGLTTGSSISDMARSAMLTARSPMRSRSVLILSAARDQPQIGGHGLLQGEQADGELVDLDLDLVDARLVAENILGRVLVLLHHRADAALDGRFHQRAHLQQLGLKLIQFFYKMAQ